MIEMFRCPSCGKKAKSFWGLITHYRIHCQDGECPVCKAKVRNLAKHLFYEAEKDEEHKIVYGLFVHPNKTKFKKKIECREFAYERCLMR